MRKYICISCGRNSDNLERLNYLCGCTNPVFAERTQQGFFKDLSSRLNFPTILSLIAGAIINTLVLTHCDWSLSEKILECFCLGILLAGILT